MANWEAARSCKVFDNCVRCLHGVPHPPLLVEYDPEKRNYVLADGRRCVARWASTNHYHGAGSVCGAEPDKTVAGIDLCGHHADLLTKWRYFEEPEERVRRKTDRLREADEEYEKALDESEAHRERVRAARSVVYYIRRSSDGAVKIGTTTAFTNRMNALRSEHGELRVLLTHSGGLAEERAMHSQFGAYRIGRTEWFAPAKDLLRWIDSRRRYNSVVRSRTWMSQSDLRKLIAAAPDDRDLQYRNGTVCWPPLAA